MVGNNLSLPGVGVDNLVVRAAPTFVQSKLLDIIRQFFIDSSEYLIYTIYRTNVCVYKGVRIMNEQKEMLTKLLDKLTSNQIEYLYYLACKLFGHTPD